MIINIVIVLALIALSHGEPKCHLSEMWKCSEIGIDWLHSLPEHSVPVSTSELNIMCQEGRKTIQCFNGFGNRCMTPLQREMATLVFEGSVELLNELCTEGTKTRAKYLKHAPCLNKVSHMDEIKVQLEHIIAVFKKSHSVPPNDMIPYTCCGIKKNCNSLLNLIRKTCDEEAADLVKDLRLLAIGQLPDALCKQFDGTEQICQDLLPPDDAKLTTYDDSFVQTLRDVLKHWLE